MGQSGKRILFDAGSRRWFPGGELEIFPAAVRPRALRLLGGGLILALVALVVVVLLIGGLV
jgi:hypothetical protein